ncbi:MAG: hypothetical protein JWP58_2754 [Hymenobacter sp.]|nr:hypothetical protein [Hymenobacter sp.]
MQVSFYTTITDTIGTPVPLADVLHGIRTGTWQAATATVRTAPTKVAQRAAKRRVPYFTASGTFAPRSAAGLRQHSGLLALDIDADQNPGLDMAALRARLEPDPHTYACFASVGGRGLCLLVPIAPAPAQHQASFRAVQAHYQRTYGVRVDSLPDVARARFVSHDPALYLNPAARPWLLPAPEPAPTAAQPAAAAGRPAGSPPEGPSAYGQTVLRAAVLQILQAPDGQKHTTLNKMAFWCGGYVASGYLAESEAEASLREAIGRREVADLGGAHQTIRAGLQAGQLRPLLPEPVQYAVRTQRRHGHSAEAVVARLQTTQPVPAAALRQAVQAVFEEPAVVLGQFWDVVPAREARRAHAEAAEGGPRTTAGGALVLNRAKYLAWLASEGFALHKQGQRYVPVHIIDNVVREVTRAELKKHVLDYVAGLPFEFDNVFRLSLEDRIQKEHRQLFEDGTLEFLPPVGDRFVRDTKDVAYFFFQNVWVEVTAATLRPRPYAELPGYIWASQRLPRHFMGYNLLRPPGPVEAWGEFGQYLDRITAATPARLEALTTALGYLLHSFRTRTACYAVVLCDEALGRSAAAGRTGKGLLVQALEKLRQVVKLDGKNFDINRPFAWQRVRYDTKLVVLDDLDTRKLPFEKLFSIITTGMEVEQKGGLQQYLDFYDAPKLLINTNDTLVGEGASHEGRKVELEVAPYFSPRHTPRDEFGHELFDDWTEGEWQLFDNLLLRCVQRYLAVGIRRVPPINLNRRKLMQKTCEEFADFADQDICPGQWYGKRALWHLFRDTCGFDEKQCSQRRFNGWLSDLAYYQGYTLVEQRQTAGFAPGQRDVDVRFDVPPPPG